MDYLQLLANYLTPKTIKCLDEVEQQFPPDDEPEHSPFAVHHPKVPSFEALLNPIRTICSRHEHIRGFKFELNMGLSPYFNTSYAWNLPSSGQAKNPMKPNSPTFMFSSQLVQNIVDNEPQTIYTARMDNDGKLEAFFIKKLAPNLNLRLNGMFMNSNVDSALVGFELDHQTKDSNLGIKFMNGIFNMGLMQRVHKKLELGFDFSHISQQSMSLYGYAARFRHRSHTFLFQHMASQGATNLAYSIPIKKGTTFVANFSHELRQNKTKSVIGLRQRYKTSQIIATINSKGKIATALTISGPVQMPYSLKLCSIVDYMKDTYKFGYGITIGQMH